MADDITSLNKSIESLNKNLNRLTGLNLFNNAQMNEMVRATGKMRDYVEEIDEFENDVVKKAKEEELRLKAINALQKKRIELKKLDNDIAKKTKEIQEKAYEIGRKNKSLIDKSEETRKKERETLKDEIKDLASQRKMLQLQRDELEANLKTTETTTKEYEKQLHIQKQQKSILQSLGNDFKRLGGNIKSLASGTIGRFLSAGMFIEGWKNLYEMSNKVYDSYWKLSIPLQKANTGMWALKDKTEEYSKALREVKFTAAKFGYDIDKIEPMISTLQDKVKYLKKDVGGKWEWDIDSLADNAKHIISISKMMNMESDEMVTMLEERVRRFGDTNEIALNSMHEMAAATLTFNEIMGQGSVFTEEVGKHLLELHQNTKYWVQDFGMLNTMFNSHVNLLLKQGKHQKEALAIARQFQEGLQQPPDLIKWKAGSRLLGDIKNQIKGMTDDEAAKKIEQMYGLGEGRGKTLVNAIRNSKNTGYTIANILQEELGGTMGGTQATMDAWKSFMGFDSTVLKDMGLASSVADAEKIKQLYKDLYSMGFKSSTTIEEAIDKMVDKEAFANEEDREKRRNELKSLFKENLDKESPFENEVLSTMKELKAWLDTPMVQIIAGGAAGGAGIFKDTISTALGMLLATRGGSILKKGGGLISRAAGKAGSLYSGATASLNELKALEQARKADSSIIKNAIKAKKLSPAEAKNWVAAQSRLMDTERALQSPAMRHAKNVSRLLKGGVIAAGIGVASHFLGSGRNRYDEDSFAQREREREAVVTKGLSSIDLVKQGFASSIEEAVALQKKFTSSGNVSIGQTVKSGFGALEGVATVLGGPLTAGIGAVTGAVEAFSNDSNIAKGAIAGMSQTFVGAAEEVLGFLADATDSDDYKRAAKAVSTYKKELGYLTGSLKVGTASISKEGTARLERTANALYGKRALDRAGILTTSKGDLMEFVNQFDWGKSLTSTRKIAKAGWFGNKTMEEYLESKGLAGDNVNVDTADRYRAMYATSKEIARARLQSKMSEYSEKDIEAEAQAIMEEQLALQQENARIEQEQMAKQIELEQDMAKYDETIMKNSNQQRDALNLLGQKTAIDMLRNRDDYLTRDDKGKYMWKTHGDNITIENASPGVASLIGRALHS